MTSSPVSFAPVAIVGRACTLPGAHTPAELWQAVAEGRDLLSPAPAGRWQLDPERVMRQPDESDPDRAWSDRGGYVQGFEQVWNPQGFAIAAGEFDGLAPLALWTLHCARQARDACHTFDGQRTGAVFGNLGFPTERMAAFAQQVWRGDGSGDVDPRNRYMSSGTADLLRRALRLDAGSHCLDAACASALYAIKLACDRLHEGSADLMLAGAVQGADDLFLHVGFCALNALSRSGRSRPFHREADGLVPAEGAAFFALKRLADARRDGDRIHGVIRAVGLSNDGRGKGLLVPTAEGQQRAMRTAYASAGIRPAQIGLLECHATGTPVGDATELASTAAVFDGCRNVPIGSLKSNLGHLITTAGAAGLIKVLEAMAARQRPASLHADAPTPALAGTPFRVLNRCEGWPSEAPRIAAVSAFGFGGNNAHLIVSEDDPDLPDPAPDRPLESTAGPLAIVGIGAMVASAADREAFGTALMTGTSLLDAHGEGRIPELVLTLDGLRVPPSDLAQTLPQQLALLQTCREALADAPALARDATGVFIGMEPDPEVARYGARWRLAQTGLAQAPLAAARDAIVPALTSAAVLGTMPNIPANRLGSQFDFAGPAFTVQAGAASGLEALRIAARALARHELDAAVVGAVDFSCEPVHRAASHGRPGDAALCLVLKRLADAQRDGDRIYACIDNARQDGTPLRLGDAADGHQSLAPRVGHAHAASGLLHVVAAALCLYQRCGIDGQPRLGPAANRASVHMAGHPPLWLSAIRGHSAAMSAPAQRLHVFSGADKAEVIAALKANRPSLDLSRHLSPNQPLAGDARLVLVGEAKNLPALREKALAHLERGAPAGQDVHFRERPLRGGIAFAFAGAGASYHGMGRSLLQHLPQLGDHLAQRSQRLPDALGWAFADPNRQPSALEQLWGASALSQLHVELTQGLLGLSADAWLGYSSGETNALVASRTWRDTDALMAEMETSGLVTHKLGGAFTAIEQQWRQPVHWASWTVLAPLAEVQAALQDLPRVHIAIIHSDHDCLIAGDADSCAQAVARIGASRCLELIYPLAVHVPELAAVSEDWLQLHRRATTAPAGRIYSNAFGGAYAPDRERCAQAILQQADRCLDLRPAVLAAWNDGIRMFIEHGPGGAYGRAIRTILGEREALVVSLDRKGQGIEATLSAIATLMAAGVPVNLAALYPDSAGQPATPQRRQHFAAHPPAIRWPLATMTTPAPVTVQILPRAPALPPVHAPALPSRRQSHPPSYRNTAMTTATMTHAPAVLAPYSRQIAQLAQLQQGFLQQHAHLHQRYLALGKQALQVLLQVPPMPARMQMPVQIPTTDDRSPPHRYVFDRHQLEVHASGRISELFGPDFVGQDGFHRQVRMPQPPLLLADRVTALDAMPNGMAVGVGTGTIQTETDVHWDSWYLHHGHMPAGVLIESGQADLMLISWLGVDRFNRSERVYRLLGCELTYHGDLPRAGDTVRFDITLDNLAVQGDVRLMFFHYDCMLYNGMTGQRPQLSVRKGQAGFFTDAELAESAGCLWTPEAQAIVEAPQLDAPAVAQVPTQLDRGQLEALAAGDAYACFGAGFERAQTHTRTPGIQHGRMQLLDRVSAIHSRGGPWQRGYLRAELDISPAQWFFDGHFKNDPCMPGTLMFEGCLQAMAVYLVAQGYSLARDGWRFQPVPEIPYQLQCRGQVTPQSHLLVTEVFVEEIIAGPVPTVYADLLCTVDGLKAFHARRVALQLVPDWPLTEIEGSGDLAGHAAPTARALCDETTAMLTAAAGDSRPVAQIDGFAFDQRSLLACAIGRPSEAFGPIYHRFDGSQRVARLPAPPYLFMSRIREVHGAIGVMKAGARVVAEYDIPRDAWYFERNGNRTMPFAVLLEAALQPCGWLSSYVGSALTESGELGFRNLDGEGVLLDEVFDNSGTLTTEVTLTDVSATAGMIIESFQVRCRLGEREIYRLETVFGFFPPTALANQAGLRTDAVQQELLERDGAAMISLQDAARNATPRLADGMLLMLDGIEGHWPTAGKVGLGQLRAAKLIDNDQWFFKAHFFQDPVQPGSLGLEAMLQALQWHMQQSGMADGIDNPRFEPIALHRPHRWKYRGQVLPRHRKVQTTLEITETGRDPHGAWALANASLWADGQRIYEMEGVGMRVAGG